MELYENQKFLEGKIVGFEHSIIHDTDYARRTAFLKGIEERHPIEPGNNPAVIYLDQFGFNYADVELSDRDAQKIYIMSNRYLELCITAGILERTPNNRDLSDLINAPDGLFLEEGVTIETIEDILKKIITSIDCYKEYYRYINGAKDKKPSNNITIKGINLNAFIRKYRKVMGMQSHFALILDHKQPISNHSVMAVNGLARSIESNNLSVNVAPYRNEWPFFNVSPTDKHPRDDFKDIDLDGSYQKTIKGFIKQIGIK